MLTLLALLACHPEYRSEPVREVVEHGTLTRETFVALADWGMLPIDVEIEVEHTSFSIDLYRDNTDLRVSQVIDPTGAVVLDRHDWANAPRILTDAMNPSNDAASFAWPILDDHPDLVPGTWQVIWQASLDRREPWPLLELEAAVHKRADPLGEVGTLTLRIVYAEGVDDDPADVAAIDDALGVVGDIFAPAGIQIVSTTHASDLDPVEDMLGAEGVTAVHAQVAEPGDLVVVLTRTATTAIDTRGVTSSTPACLMPTPWSALQVLLDNNRVGDDPLAAIDVEELGLTIAHEVGHALGLPHPFARDTYDEWDAIDDTPECTDYLGCIDALSTNLMYPGRVCDAPNDCRSNRSLTSGQIAVLRRAVAVH